MIFHFFSKNNSQETDLMPIRLPSWTVRSAGRIIIFIFVIALIGSMTIQLPETIRCPFILMPEGGTTFIQSPIYGILDQMNITEGQRVQKGFILFHIRSKDILSTGTQLKSLEKDLDALEKQHTSVSSEIIMQQQADKSELQNLTNKYQQIEQELSHYERSKKFSTEKYNASVNILEAELIQRKNEAIYREEYANTYNDLLGRYEKLDKLVGVSHVELIRERLNAAKAELDANLAKSNIQMTLLKIKQQKVDYQQNIQEIDLQIQRKKFDQEQILFSIDKLKQELKIQDETNDERLRGLVTAIEKIKMQIADLQKELEHVDGDIMRIICAYDGIIVRMTKNKGDIVERGQPICQIANSEGKLRAELIIPEEAMPQLKPEQSVILLFNAFPYQRYGIKRAQLQWISPSIIETNDQKQFQAVAEISQLSVQYGTVTHCLRSGMKGEARIITGYRTLIEFILDPIRSLMLLKDM